MLLTVFDHMEQATPAAVAALLPQVSAQRREQALRFHHVFGQFCCLKSYVMLKELLAALSPTLDGESVEFVFGEHGQPFLRGRDDIFFSISHTRSAIVVAAGFSPVGVDVETVREVSPSLVEKVMSPAEQAQILVPSDFMRFWTQKEALLKWRGTGIQDDLRPVLQSASVPVLSFAPRGKDYIYSVVEG